jgi:hypothetical protein
MEREVALGKIKNFALYTLSFTYLLNLKVEMVQTNRTSASGIPGVLQSWRERSGDHGAGEVLRRC